MSTQPTPPAAAPAPPPPPTPLAEQKIIIYSHSFMFYWWPVWVVGFIFGLIITPLSGQRLAIVPDHTAAEVSTITKEQFEKKKPGKYVDVTITQLDDSSGKVTNTPKPAAKILLLPEKTDVTAESLEPKLHISNSKNHGVFFFSIVLFVIFVTTVPLRGLLSIMVIMLVVFMVIIFALAGVWDKILTHFSFIDIRMNQGGYLFLSTVLFIMWLMVFLLYDKQIYVVFKPGQVVIRLTIGEGETAHGTDIMVLQKLRSNFFLHWILGLGTSDLVIKFSGPVPEQYDLPNVFVGSNRLAQIENLARAKAVVPGRQQ